MFEEYLYLFIKIALFFSWMGSISLAVPKIKEHMDSQKINVVQAVISNRINSGLVFILTIAVSVLAVL